jgi:2-phospho-L-lactate/phosphoenolpyruvate guanylyltransferase
VAELHVLVPVKRLDHAKSRLAGALAPADRRALALAMLGDVLAAVGRSRSAASLTVVTGDPEAAAAARLGGATARDDEARPWNAALMEAIAALPAGSATAIVAGDLPLLERGDLDALVDALGATGVVVGRAHDGGTNALALGPAGAIAPHFGEPASAAVHARLAREAGYEPIVLDRPGLAVDLDTEDDLARLLHLGPRGLTAAALAARVT